MRERFVVRQHAEDGLWIVWDTDKLAITPYADWSQSEDGLTPGRTDRWPEQEYAQQVADYRNSVEQYQKESDDSIGDDYVDLEEPVNGFVEWPYGGRPVCFRCFTEWVGMADEEVLNYRRFEGTAEGIECVNDCGGGKVKKWAYDSVVAPSQSDEEGE